MIKINVKVRDFNKINKFGKMINGRNIKGRPQLKYTKLLIKGDKLKVEGLDGYKLYTLNFDIDNINKIDGVLYIEPMKNFKISDNIIVITEGSEEIRINDIRNNDIRVLKNEEVDFFNTDKIYEEEDPTFEISFTVEHLRDTLRAYESDDIIDLKFFHKNKQVIIDNRLDAKSLVLPVRRS